MDRKLGKHVLLCVAGLLLLGHNGLLRAQSDDATPEVVTPPSFPGSAVPFIAPAEGGTEVAGTEVAGTEVAGTEVAGTEVAVGGSADEAVGPTGKTFSVVPDSERVGESETQQQGQAGLRGVLRLFGGPEVHGAAKSGSAVGEETDEDQKRVQELTRLALSSVAKNRLAEATRNINDLIALKPYDSNYHFALGLCYRRQGKFDDALKKFQDVLDLGGPKALVAVLRAEAYADKRERDKVIQFLEEAAIGGRNIIMDMGTLPALGPYQQDTEFVKLALQLEKFSVSVNKSHDPFTNPFPKFNLENQGDSLVAEGVVKLTPEEQEKLLLDARKTYERVKFYIKLEDEGKAMKEYVALRAYMKNKDMVTIPKIANDFRILVAQLENLEIEIEGIRLKYYYNQAQNTLKSMKESFTDGEYKKVESLHSEIVKLTQEMRLVNKNYVPVADRILEFSSSWDNRARIRQEFDQMRPNIQGIVIAPDGKLAVLNNRLVKQGEAMDDFRVVRVESNKVTFRYKGEDIPLLFRRY